MKKFIYGIFSVSLVFLVVAVVSVAHAAVTTDIPSPQPDNIVVTFTADTGDMLEFFLPVWSFSNSVTTPFSTTGNALAGDGTYTVVECLNSLSLDGCAASNSADAEADPGYISNISYEFDSPPVIYGCTDSFALNYDSSATAYDGSCEYRGATTTYALFPIATSSSGFALVDNPVLDLFLGMVLFFVAFWGVIWLFRRSRS